MNTGKSIGQDGLRADQKVVADLIPNNSRVLDVGSGDGALLRYLVRHKAADARGLEISQPLVSASVTHGLSVIQGNAEEDLGFYPDQAFDYVVLSKTIQAMHRPKDILQDILRIGKYAIVSLPNFGHWKVRWQLVFGGRMPVSEFLSYQWYDTPNIHFCTIRDFTVMMDDMGVIIDQAIRLDSNGVPHTMQPNSWMANLFGEQAVFLLRRAD